MTLRSICTNPDCGRPTDGYLCNGCQSQLRNALAGLPGLLAELQVTVTRQSVTTRTSISGAKPTATSEEPLAYDVDAADMDWAVRNTVTTWARVVVEERYPQPLPTLPALPELVAGPTCLGCFKHDSCNEIRGSVAQHHAVEAERGAVQAHIDRADPPKHFSALCGWLAYHLPWIMQQPWADQMHDEITSIRPFATRTVDSREDRYAGPCTAQVVAIDLVESSGLIGFEHAERQCGADLRLRSGAQRIRCRTCGADYDAQEREGWISKQVAGQLAPAALIAQALTEAGTPIKAATIRKWSERTRQRMAKAARRQPGQPYEAEPYPIQQIASRVADRAPLYLVGAVYERVKAMLGRDTNERISA